MRLVLASASPRRAELLRAAGFRFEIVVADVDEQMRPGEVASAYVRRLAAEKSATALRSGAAKAAPYDCLPQTIDVTSTGTARAVPDDGLPHTIAAAGTAKAAPHDRLTDTNGAISTSVGHRFSGADLGSDDDVIVLGADTVVVVDGRILGKPRDDDEAASMLRQLSGRRHAVLTGISLRHGGREVGRVEVTAVQFTELSDAELAWYVASGEGRDKAGAYAIQGLASRFVSRIEGSYSNVVGLPVAAVHELLSSHLASRL